MTGAGSHPELGRPVAEHPPNYGYAVRRVLGGGLSIGVGVVLGLGGLGLISPRFNDDPWETPAALLGGAIFLAIGVFFALEGILSTGPRVTVYEQGFVAGGAIFRWDQVAAFYQLVASLNAMGLPVSLTEYEVRRSDGRKVRFTRGISGADKLAVLIQERINPRLLAAARAALAAGQEVRFGDAALDPQGLTFVDATRGDKRQISWDDLSTLQADGMIVQVRRRDESRLARLTGAGDSMATRSVANVTVLLVLVSEILAARKAR